MILCIILRFYKLGDFPDGVHIDEAAFGYNAYSILKTGKDQFGNSFPFFFESEGDYKLPVHVYLSTLSVSFFGLNSFSVRFTTLLMGYLLVISIFILTYQITHSYKKSVLAAFLLSISPWHFLFSRQGTEVVTCAVFSCLSLIFFIQFVRREGMINIILFLGTALLAMFTYRTATIFIIIFYALFFLLISANYKKRKKFALAISYTILFLLFLLLTTSLLKRYTDVKLFDSQELRVVTDLNLREDGTFSRPLNNQFVPRIFHNKLENLIISVQKNFWSQLDYSTLFFKGDNLNNSIPNLGNMYFFEVTLFIVFLFFLKKLTEKNIFFIIPMLWIFSSILPSSITLDAVNSSRTFQASIGYVLAISIGLIIIINLLNNHNFKFLFKGMVVILYAYGLFTMLHSYFVHKPMRTPWYRDVGLNEAVSYIENHKNQYEKIIFGNDIYTLYAYRAKLDPAFLQKRIAGITDNREKRTMKRLDDKFVTDVQNCNLKEGEANVLYVCFGRKIPITGQIIKTFTFRDGQPNVTLYEYDSKSKVNRPINMEYY